jgi:hypothetical protein
MIAFLPLEKRWKRICFVQNIKGIGIIREFDLLLNVSQQKKNAEKLQLIELIGH